MIASLAQQEALKFEKRNNLKDEEIQIEDKDDKSEILIIKKSA